MKTHIGKIAQLPKSIRDQLNQRLENGKQAPELLQWLNNLPETQTLLAEKFDRQPITKSNLSDWRLGGYRDWLRLKAREERIQRITESGDSLYKLEGDGDLFENFARIVIAELSVALESLDEIKNRDQRWHRLRELSHELARLQNGYNRSRWADLAWTRWNNRPEEITTEEPILEIEETSQAESEPPISKPTASPVLPASLAPLSSPVVPSRAKSYDTPPRFLHRAPCGCICRKCHAADSDYPYWDAEHDDAHRKPGSHVVEKENGQTSCLLNWNCDCTCEHCESKTGRPESPTTARRSIFRIIHHTKCKCGGICLKCHAPDSEYPLPAVLRDQQLVQESQSSILRNENGISTCLRTSLCNCPCDQCAKKEPEEQETTQDDP